MTASLTRATFAPLVGATFRVEGPATFDAALVELADGRSQPGWEQFSLFFAAPSDAPAAQGLYRVANDAIGAVDLFLVPVERDEQRLLCEAVINRRAEEGDAT